MKNIAIVIPACNEEAEIAACLTAVQRSVDELYQAVNTDHIDVKTYVVLDSCIDQTMSLAQQFNVQLLCCDFRCVGKSRDYGIRHAITQGCDWICCTDADSTVHQDWLSSMLVQQPVEMICGVVDVIDWQQLSESCKSQYLKHYQDVMHHQHIHGANLSFSADLYQKLNGFKALHNHEDVDLVQRAQHLGADILWSNLTRVTTSSRLNARATAGFAHFLSTLEQQHNMSSVES